MTRASIVFVALSSLVVACVETDDPTGPAPTPPGDEGELTSAVVTEAGVVDLVAGARARTLLGASAERVRAAGPAPSAMHESVGSALTPHSPLELA